MKKLAIVGVSILALSVSTFARDDVKYFSIKDAINTTKAKEVLDPNIKISFGTGTNAKFIVKGITSNKKTNAFHKSDEQACSWALLSALKSFQERAVREGGTKVVNLVGYYKKRKYDSKTKFQCGAGNIMAGVTLKGDIAK